MDTQLKKASGQEIVRALSISSVCIITYFVSYYLRNILSVSTPSMLSDGSYTEALVGSLSSVYMLSYAVGQLVNGYIGDRVKPKYMALLGLFIGGAVTAAFPYVKSFGVCLILFGMLGFSLSMLRGPLVKTICENVRSSHAQTACVFLSFVCNAGPLVASLFAMFLDWEMTFTAAGISAIFFSLVSFVTLSVFERRGLIAPRIKPTEGGKRGGVLALFGLDGFVFYMILGMVAEISHTTITFWLPTYLTGRLGFDETVANLVFSAIALSKTVAPFLAIFVLRLFRSRDVLMARILFLVSASAFVGVIFTPSMQVLNIVLIICALVLIGMCSNMLWSVYIPRQGKSGLVSTLNGFLDFSGYLAASAANMLISLTMAAIGWSGIVAMWAAFSAAVFVASILLKTKRKAPEEA